MDKNGQPLPQEPLSSTFIDQLDEPFWSMIARECIPLVTSSVANTSNEQEQQQHQHQQQQQQQQQQISMLPSAAERADQLQIQLQTQLLKLIQAFVTDSEDTNNGDALLQDVMFFWKGSLDLCLHLVVFCEAGKDDRYKGMSVRKLPLLLLEDALDSLPLASFQQIWNAVVEPALPILLSAVMWHHTPTSTPCALPFIKLCNKFLKALSHEQQGDWSGSILQIMAKAFSLSDKSATKIWGSFHTDNITELESQTIYEESSKAVQQQLQQQDKEEEDDYLSIGASKLEPLSIKYQTFNFYKTFWGIQHDFSNPTGIKVGEFLERMKTILAALESHPLTRTKAATASTTTTSMMTTTNKPIKYLTSSHLLPIQLGDAEFRMHFLTQFLIIENHLSAESPALGDAIKPLQSRAVELLKHIPAINNDVGGNADSKNGAEHWEILDFILRYRETHWRQWKKSRCQFDMEEPLVKHQTDGDEADKKRKRSLLDGPLDGDSAPSKKPKDEEDLLIDFILHEKKNLKATCALPKSTNSQDKNESSTSNDKNTRATIVPSLEEHLSSYVDALDPEAGIEAEYHPKNDSLFTWRALRLLSRDHLGKFHMINHKGDFEKMVRSIYAEEKSIDIPGEVAVEDASIVDEEEATVPEDEDMEDATGNGGGVIGGGDEDDDDDRASQERDVERKGESEPGSPLDEGVDRESVNDNINVKNPTFSKNEDKSEESLVDGSDESDDNNSEEPRRQKSEIFDSDEGEIEEGKRAEDAPSQPASSAETKEDPGKDVKKEEPTKEPDSQAKTESGHFQKENNNTNKGDDQNNDKEGRRSGGKSDRGPKGRNLQGRPPSPPHNNDSRSTSRGGRDHERIDAPQLSHNASLAGSYKINRRVQFEQTCNWNVCLIAHAILFFFLYLN